MSERDRTRSADRHRPRLPPPVGRLPGCARPSLPRRHGSSQRECGGDPEPLRRGAHAGRRPGISPGGISGRRPGSRCCRVPAHCAREGLDRARAVAEVVSPSRKIHQLSVEGGDSLRWRWRRLRVRGRESVRTCGPAANDSEPAPEQPEPFQFLLPASAREHPDAPPIRREVAFRHIAQPSGLRRRAPHPARSDHPPNPDSEARPDTAPARRPGTPSACRPPESPAGRPPPGFAPAADAGAANPARLRNREASRRGADRDTRTSARCRFARSSEPPRRTRLRARGSLAEGGPLRGRQPTPREVRHPDDPPPLRGGPSRSS